MGDPWQRKEVIGDCTLYLGDCMEIMPALGFFDAVVTDPPYGIGEDGGKFRDRKGGRTGVKPKKSWDKTTPEAACFNLIRFHSQHQIIWGGNYFADKLPASKGWLYWQKRLGGNFSDGELAWTNRDSALREFSFCPSGGSHESYRFHPTQKPLPVMAWCLGFLTDCRTILDPFMGSGTTGVACLQAKKSFVGIERDTDYFEAACVRISKAAQAPYLSEVSQNEPDLLTRLK